MRGNAVLLFRLFEELHPFIRPGSTGLRIQEFCLEYFRRHGMRSMVHGYRDFPAQVCVSRNEVAAHGLPDLLPLAPGDLVTVDAAASRGGFCADAAWTYLVPGGVGEGIRLVEAAWAACLAGVRAGGELRRLSAIGQAVQRECKEMGFRVLSRFAGHGLGRHLHEAPQFAFLGQRQSDDRLESGMVVNVEPVVAPEGTGDDAVRLGPDGWSWVCPAGSRTAQYELSLAIEGDHAWSALNFPDGFKPDARRPPFF
jgi:methionyl aminopeptidase